MVPADFNSYFSASASAAAALVGLLFVAISLAPESTLARSAPLRRRAIAISAFTGLLNAFFISLSALIPGVDFAQPLLGISTASLISTLISTWFLLTRRQPSESLLRLLFIPLLGFAIYGLEIGVCALPLLQAPTSLTPATPIIWLAFLLFGVYGLALTRAWQLMAGVPAAIAARAHVAQDKHDVSSGASPAAKSVQAAAPAAAPATIKPAEDSAT